MLDVERNIKERIRWRTYITDSHRAMKRKHLGANESSDLHICLEAIENYLKKAPPSPQLVKIMVVTLVNLKGAGKPHTCKLA